VYMLIYSPGFGRTADKEKIEGGGGGN
jgi:hypothetical protein